MPEPADITPSTSVSLGALKIIGGLLVALFGGNAFMGFNMWKGMTEVGRELGVLGVEVRHLGKALDGDSALLHSHLTDDSLHSAALGKIDAQLAAHAIAIAEHSVRMRDFEIQMREK